VVLRGCRGKVILMLKNLGIRCSTYHAE
jgi:hypothetical protein